MSRLMDQAWGVERDKVADKVALPPEVWRTTPRCFACHRVVGTPCEITPFIYDTGRAQWGRRWCGRWICWLRIALSVWRQR